MEWPVEFPAEMTAESTAVRSYVSTDAVGLFEVLADERVWAHMSRPAPADVATLDELIRSALAGGNRITFAIRCRGRAVGITSVLFDPDDPAGAEIGGTLLALGAWGTGVNAAAKRLLLDVIFSHGAAWVQLRTDERNERSAAAIRKLGATDLGIHDEPLVRRDGSRRRSLVFRIEGMPPLGGGVRGGVVTGEGVAVGAGPGVRRGPVCS